MINGMINGNALVSIITPCYNSANYIRRMIESVIAQTYKKIELICVDDGSDDSTVEIINSYEADLKKDGINLICIKKKHEGQAAAVNCALKIIKGDFFVLLDSDDYLLPKSIEKRVEKLRAFPQYGVVASDYYIVDEDNIDEIKGRGNESLGWLPFQKRQFELLITGLSLAANTGYMIRTEYMRKVNPLMNIYESIEGQNYQILLPMYYHYDRIYIDEPLAVYVIRKNSHDHIYRNRFTKIQRGVNLLNMLRETMKTMGIENEEIKKYLKLSSFNCIIENA